jgi:heat shock protein HtpX
LYEQIAANRRRSVFLIFSFALLLMAIGWVFGQITGFGYGGLAIAAVVAVVYSWGSYYYSDRLVLAMSRAKPADPVAQARLHNIVEGLAIAAGIGKPKVYIVDDPAPNAFATGRNPQHSAVAVTTGLLEKMDRVELEGVIAHEMSHIRNHDILVTTIAVTLTAAVVLLADWMLRSFWFGGGRRRNNDGNNPIALVIAIGGLVLALLSPLIAQLIQAAVSRKRESLADVSGVELTRYPPGLISALKKLRDDTTVVRTGSRATAHLWIESPLQRQGGGAGAWLNRLFDTHPPLEERIQVLEHL